MIGPLAIAVLAAVAYALLGIAVAHDPPGPLWPIDAAASGLAGYATGPALLFTMSCWWQALVTIGVLALALGWLRPEWRARAIFSVITTIVAWQTSDVLKNIFMRARPSNWYLHHESSYAYSSGHAMFAVVVYFLWSYFFATSTLPRAARTALAAMCAVWGCAVIWSRLALGAHWATDLIGGVLLGIAMLGIASTVARAWPQRVRG